MRKNNLLKALVVFLLALLLLSSVKAQDSDLDGIDDSTDQYPFDFDNDGMPDIWEKKNMLKYDKDDSKDDPDNDGMPNLEEYKKGTNPLVSETTKTRADVELFSPVERTLAKSLIWVGSIILVLILIGFFLYRSHIFRMAKFLHHHSKNFEKQQNMAKQGIPYQQKMPMAPHPGYSQQVPMPQRPPQAQRLQQMPRPIPPKPHTASPNINNKPAQAPRPHPSINKTPAKKTIPQDTTPLENKLKIETKPPIIEKSAIPEEPEVNIYDRLTDHIETHRKSKDPYESIEKVMKIPLR